MPKFLCPDREKGRFFMYKVFSSLTACFLTLTLALSLPTGIAGASEHKVVHKNAIVLAMFGTTVEPALKALLNIREEIKKAYPETPVKIAFTSNIIRKIWQKRANDPDYARKHPDVPKDILHVQGPLATIANLQDAGFDNIVVQPTHIAPAEEFLDLCSYVRGLNSIKTIKPKFMPFNKLVVGRPALGTFGPAHPYEEDIKSTVKALASDAALAKKEKAALVYMGHGNDYFPSGGSYLQFQDEMRRAYPDVLTVIGTVEGFPGLTHVVEQLKHAGIKKVVLKPMMVVAGDHAMNDMAGPEPDSWKSVLNREGIKVVPVLKGLGEQDEFARIFVGHAADAAKDAGIELR